MFRNHFFLLINIIFASFLLVTLYIFFMNFYTKYDTTVQEYHSVKKINNLIIIENSLQDLRGHMQINREGNVSSPNELLNQLKQLVSKLPTTLYKSQVANFLLHYSSANDIDAFSEIMDFTINEIYDQAEKSSLLFDTQPHSHFLISLLCIHIPQSLEMIALVREYGSSYLASKALSVNALFQIRSHMLNYTKSLAEIKKINNKLLNNEANEKIIHDIYSQSLHLQKEINKIVSRQIQMTPQSYHHMISEHMSEFILYKDQIKTDLIHELEKRKRHYLSILISIIATIILAFSLLISFFYFQRKYRDKIIQTKKIAKYKSHTANIFKETLYHDQNFKSVCNHIVQFFTAEFHAQTALLYLYEPTNNKLNLAANFGVKSEGLNHFANPDDGLLGKVYITKKSEETLLPPDLIADLSLYDIKPMKLLTVPLIKYEQIVAIIQLSFLSTDPIDMHYLNELSEIAALNLQKHQDEEHNLKLLNLIDKNVITSSTNKQGIITYVSDTFAAISEFTKEELLGKSHSIVRHPDMPEEIFDTMWRTITSGNVWRGEVKNKTKSGGFYWVDVTITPNIDFYGNILGYTAVRQDISDKKKIEEISITDALTGIYNRRYFEEIFNRKLLNAHREHKNTILILFDIDNFKQFNDTYGHPEGDAALIKVSSCINKLLRRPSDYVFRVGGEEFCVLFEADSLEDALAFGENIRSAIEELKIPHQKNNASQFLTISLGMFYFDAKVNKETTIQAYKYADAALYKAKEFGRNQLRVWAME